MDFSIPSSKKKGVGKINKGVGASSPKVKYKTHDKRVSPLNNNFFSFLFLIHC
jgi:hypothetical protein